jgi:hypothetical protein
MRNALVPATATLSWLGRTLLEERSRRNSPFLYGWFVIHHPMRLPSRADDSGVEA